MTVGSLICNGRILVEQLQVARTPLRRMKGLLGRSSLARGHGLYITPASCIHTFFMAFDLDLIFLDRNMGVVSIRLNIKPWHIVSGGRNAYSVVEMASGWFMAENLAPCDKLQVKVNPD